MFSEPSQCQVKKLSIFIECILHVVFVFEEMNGKWKSIAEYLNRSNSQSSDVTMKYML